jgi:hypothetical protein
MAYKRSLIRIYFYHAFHSIAKSASTPRLNILWFTSIQANMVIEDRNRKITLQPGDCAFIRRDHRLKMYKNSKGDDFYKGISLTFKRSVLREFYSKMDKAEVPKEIHVSDDHVFKLQPSPAIKSLFESLTPYFDSNIKPTEGVTHLKLLEGIYVLLHSNKQLYPILFDFAEPWKVDILEFLNKNYPMS